MRPQADDEPTNTAEEIPVEDREVDILTAMLNAGDEEDDDTGVGAEAEELLDAEAQAEAADSSEKGRRNGNRTPWICGHTLAALHITSLCSRQRGTLRAAT